jgi:hypothetical protein
MPSKFPYLDELNGQRVPLVGDVGAFGATPRNRRLEPTIVFHGVTLPDGTSVRPECWFTLGKGFRDQHLQVGDRVAFSARLTIHGNLVRLRYPMHIRKLARGPALTD